MDSQVSEEIYNILTSWGIVWVPRMTLLQGIVDYCVNASAFINKSQIKGRNDFPHTDCKTFSYNAESA
jgi:hypothetical protein